MFFLQIDGSTGNFYTYTELINRTERLAAGLQKWGVQPGDVISIVAPSHIEYHVIFYATTLINAILQALNPLFTKGKALNGSLLVAENSVFEVFD